MAGKTNTTLHIRRDVWDLSDKETCPPAVVLFSSD